GSEAAYRGFAHGAALQQQQAHQAEAAQLGLKSGLAGRIREVWAHNLEHEMVLLRQLITKYPYVSMDAEFPGIVARPIGNFENKASYHYQTLRCNVDLLKPIQLGITIWTADGELPPQQPDPSLFPKLPNNLVVCPCTWSFNFRFSLDHDMYAEGSIELLKKAGLDFAKHQEQGIDLNAFGAALTTSGLTFVDDVNWLSFHSGYDFGYLVKLLTNAPLPENESEFRDLVNIYFPKLWDIKFLLRHAQRTLAPQNRLSPTASTVINTLGQKSGLQDLAEELGCVRQGAAHTGGSDAWLTGSVFWAMRNKIFDGHAPLELADQIYGLHGVGPPASAAFRDEFLQSQGHQTPQTNGALNFHTGHTPTTHQAPSTPTTSHAAISGGVFGNFQYAK
ncbi:ribonuclease H-like protein, partial [Aureobasidium melanogenum]